MTDLKEILKATKYPPYLKVIIDLSLITILFYAYPLLKLNELFVFELGKVVFICSFWQKRALWWIGLHLMCHGTHTEKIVDSPHFKRTQEMLLEISNIITLAKAWAGTAMSCEWIWTNKIQTEWITTRHKF